MKVVVIGPGALGSLLAATLSRSEKDFDLWLLDHRRARAATLADQGLILEEGKQRYHVKVQAVADASEIGGSADYIFLCVKAYDTRRSIQQAHPLFSEKSLLLAFQNGIAHLPILKEFCKNYRWAVGVTSQGATLVGPGYVRHGGRGITRLGFLEPPSPPALAQLYDAAALLKKAGFEAEVAPNIVEHIWNKLLVNVGINPLTAILSCPNGKLLEIPTAETQLEAAVLEAASVARAKGINIVPDPVALTREVCRATSNNKSSMLQDVLNERPTEIDAINGAVVLEAHRLGIPVPVNEKLVREIKNIERGYLKNFS